MSNPRKGIFRLAILILALPLGMVFFLHFFGSNRMDVPILASLKDCESSKNVKVVLSGAPFSNDQKNQLTRIDKRLASKGLTLDKGDQSCYSDSLAVLLIDSKTNLRGSYWLEQNDVNRFFAELDIVLLIENYGKEVSR